MKSKILEQTLNVIKSKTIDRAIIQALLLTDGSVIPKRNRITFANTSEILIKQFCNLVSSIYGYQVKKIAKGKSTKQQVHLIQLQSKTICADLLSDIPTYRTAPFKNDVYPETTVPESWFEFNNKEIATILRAIFDADGGCSLRVARRKKRKCLEIERQIFISCQHPKLRSQYRRLLNKLDIKCGESSSKVVITGKKNFEKFRDLINFSEGVLVGYDSKHWQGIEKRKLLDILIKSYDTPYGFLQKFEKNQIYSLLRPPPR
ncbi:MAG: LAGLIDADG family homing endonuclease [Candidatus Aenigmatarchaeota archaeon]